MTRPEARPNRGGPPGPQRRHATQQTRDTNDIQRYLRALFERDEPGALIKVRHRYRDGTRSTFFAHTDTTAAARTILRLAIATDVYGGAAPRMRRASGRDAIERVWSLWADLDDADAAAALDDLPVAPAIVIASGIVRSGLARARCASGDIRRRHVISGARAIRVVSGGDDAR